MNLKQRLYCLIGCLMLVQAALIVATVIKSNSLLETLDNVSLKILPATRDLTLADMHHDGLSARIYQALYYNETKNYAAIPELTKETKEQADEFVLLMANLKKIEAEPELKKMIEDIAPRVQKYSELSIEILESVNSKNEQKIKTATADFFTEFKYLETNLALIGEKFEQFSSQQNDKGKDIKLVVIVFSVIGIILSGLVSAFILSITRKDFSEVLNDAEHVESVLVGLIDTVRMESNKVREASIEQAAAIQESASALSEMSSMINQTSSNVKLSLETSQGAIQKTTEGKEIMNKMEQSMNSIQKSNVQLQDLSKVIQNISNKTTVINDIVFKTQLLSFNASIEAARAGQHGRGFSVVAEEVGNLAEMSGQAAKEIESLLAESQSKVKETLEVIHNRVNDSNRISQLALHAFNEVSKNIEEINGQVRSISEATQQQETGIQQTNIAMRQVDVTSQENTESAANALRKVDELKQKGELLKSANSRLGFLVRGTDLSSKTINENAVHYDVKPSSSKLIQKDSKISGLDNSISADDPDFKKTA